MGRQCAILAQTARLPIPASTGPTSRSGDGIGLAQLEQFKRCHDYPSDGAVLSGGAVGALKGEWPTEELARPQQRHYGSR
jgi:hypothetical protein